MPIRQEAEGDGGGLDGRADHDQCDGAAHSAAVCPCGVERPPGDVTHHSGGYELVTPNSAAESTWVDFNSDTNRIEKWWVRLNDRGSGRRGIRGRRAPHLRRLGDRQTR